MNVRLLSWNIWMGKYLPEIVDLLRKEHPDIIAFQEVIQDQGGKNNTAETIAKKLGYHWEFAPVTSFTHEGRTVDWGEAILSRYDIDTSKVLELSIDPRHVGLLANIRIGNQTLHVISTHLTHTHQSASVHQEEEALSLVRQTPKDRTIIMGDFNALPESKTIGIMNDSLTLADSANQPTWCVYPDGCPTCYPGAVKDRLDYIFTTRDLTVSNYRVIPSDGSDHLPIAATVFPVR